jgi:hypothetical protein
MLVKEFTISHCSCVLAPADCVWRHITDVDIASFHHPAYLAALGIPKPLRSEIREARAGGVRIAYFDNNKRFMQEITFWKPLEEYSFTFRADPGFRVGYFLDLAEGPFRMKSGSYTISLMEGGVRLRLTSRYELRGASGLCLSLPVWLSLGLFQNYLLRGIKANAERENAQGNPHHCDRGGV